MPRKLILCLDGTSNKFARDNTNVIKLLAMLEKDATDQFIYYQPGIGTMPPPGLYGRFWRWLTTRLDLAFGILLKYHVQEAYQFLMRYYEAGDEIFLFGFSRGAYTARVLAGMLHKVGLIARGNEEMVPFAWAMYRPPNNDDLAKAFRNTFGKKVRVRFLGVWDTVNSVRWAGRAVHLPKTRDNESVDTVRHAVSLDERRAYFRQNLWRQTAKPTQDFLEAWFPGVHCDVGGGYLEKDSGLSKVALQWMVAHAQAAGLNFHPSAISLMLPMAINPQYSTPNSAALLHESLRGAWWLLELIPKRVADPTRGFAKRWIIPRGARRSVVAGATIHQSVLDRMNAGIGYTPSNLPINFQVATTPPIVLNSSPAPTTPPTPVSAS